MDFTVRVYVGGYYERVVKAAGPKHAAKKAMQQIKDDLRFACRTIDGGEGDKVEAADVYLGDPKAGGEYQGEFDLRDVGLD